VKEDGNNNDIEEVPELENEQLNQDYSISTGRMILILLVVLSVAGGIYRALLFNDLEQSAALFIGLPAALAIALSLVPRAKSVTGSILQAITFAILLSGPILGEGILCMIIASPLFYLVGIIIGVVEDIRRRRAVERSVRLRALVWLPIFIMSFEGVTETLSFPRQETITVKKTVQGTVGECEQQLAQTPSFPKTLPTFLAAGWPRPTKTSGSGLNKGDLRSIYFTGSEGSPGTLTMQVSERRPGFVRFETVNDTSHMPHWLEWDNSAVTMKPAGDGFTEVEWSTTYIRRLDPAWYFRPWQQFAVTQATEYLIDNLATPRS